MASKPKNWDSLSPVEQNAWRVRVRESDRKWREANPEKARESVRKYREANPEKKRKTDHKYRKANLEKVRESNCKTKQKAKNQSAADQFFIMAGAAEQLTKLKPKSYENNTNE